MRDARRWLPVALWLLAMAVAAVLVARARFTADMSAFLPQAPTAEQQLLVDQLSDGLVSRLILVGITGADAGQRAELSRRLAAQLRADAKFVAVANGESTGMERDQALLFRHRYALSPAVTPERFGVPGLRAAIQDTLDLLASPAGLLVKDLVPRDPTGEIVTLVEQLGAQSATAQNRPRILEGVWASRDGRRAVLLLQTRAPGGDTDAQQAAVHAVHQAFDRARGETGAQAASLQLAGPGVFGVQIRERIEREVTRLSAAGTALIVVLLLLLYRSLPALVLGLLPVASGVLVAIAAVSLGFGTVHGLTLGFGTTLIGEAVDYSIYLFVQSRQGGGRTGEADWARRFWPTIRLGVLTSLFGFAALLFSGFPGLAQLGLYSIAGLATAALVTRWVLPRLLPERFAVRDISAPGLWLSRAVASAGALRWPALALVAASLLVLVLHRDRVWNHELAALNPTPAADQALDQSLRADLGAPDVRFLVVIAAGSQEQALAGAEQAAAALQPLVERNLLGGVDSPTHLLPPMATQRARLAAIPPRPELERRLREALAGLPLQPSRLQGFLEDAERARQSPPVQRADLDGTTLAVAVDGMLVQRTLEGQGAQWRAFLPLHAPRGASGTLDPAPIRAALAALPAQAGRVLLVDLKGEADALYSGYLREALLLSLAGLVAIVILIAVALRSLRATLRVMAPLAGAVLAVMAGLALAGQALSILHLIGLLLVVAVGSNYALFFAGGGKEGGILPTTLASLLFANVAAVLGFGILALSSVPVLHAIGITVGPGAVLALVLAAVFAAPRRAERAEVFQ
ncbi:MMPL family transporter [Ramlibacter tataouinensis]|uniref:Candidate membrane protein n=1 Tax=Ramlibacter tataouinensis (strain ATCC BAA-407 / DSM 14655 / LMG 21543 / TTB310) TaxID=365046 RepID=F5Y4K4_RAMTT|nr:MMPL family transporter [Ramlibacter tataouinensis]AEG91322.1 candidate membrane protein [Ramlibacter tataouinensis TTB310]